MQLTQREKHWLMKEAWTYIGYDKPDKACTILEYIDKKFANDLDIKKMLMLALLNQGSYEKVIDIADLLLKNVAGKDKYPVYLCKIRALNDLGRKDDAEMTRKLIFTDSIYE